jgi:hypothetical protein
LKLKAKEKGREPAGTTSYEQEKSLKLEAKSLRLQEEGL